jgi:hypothetical protein
LEKNYSLKKIWIKNYNLPIPRPPYRTSKLQKKPSALKRGHPTLQNMNFKKNSTFVGHFCPPGSGSGFRIRIPNPDPLTRLNPDPQHCFEHIN